jgi:hypothetical protein
MIPSANWPLVLLAPAKFTAAVNGTCGHIFLAIYSDRSVTGGEYVTGDNDAGGE